MFTKKTLLKRSISFRHNGLRGKHSYAVTGICLAMISACGSEGLSVNESQASLNTVGVSSSLDVSGLMTRTKLNDSGSPVQYLLVNGSFEEGLKGWQSCTPNPPLKIVNDAADGEAAVLVKSQNCVQQGVSVNPGRTLTLRCDAKMDSKKNDWTGIGFSFYDEYWNFIDEPSAALVNGRNYNTYTVTGDIPENARNVGVWLYTENRAIVDNCELTSVITPPPSSANLLENPQFEENIAGWRNACPDGFAEHSSGFGGLLYTGNKSCVHHHLSDEATAEIKGKKFEYSCTYTSSHEGESIMATNLPDISNSTTKRLPRTYFDGVPNWNMQTVTISGRAAEDMPYNPYVMIGSQVPDGIAVLGCSLTVIPPDITY